MSAVTSKRGISSDAHDDFPRDTESVVTGVTLSDFNAANFDSLLSGASDGVTVRMLKTPFGQVHPLLVDAAADCWQQRPDFAVVWTQPDAVLPSFGAAMQHAEVSRDQILLEVDDFTAQVVALHRRTRAIFVPLWTRRGLHRGLGLLDLKEELGIGRLLLEMNLRLVQRLQEAPNVYPLDAPAWVQAVGARAFVPKLWYMAKVPYSNDVFKRAASEIRAALQTLRGETRKLVVVDLDNTLWGGLVGEVGWQNLTLGGHHAEGEAYVDFQRALKALSRRGTLLAIASKNDERTALEAIDHHPEMVLRRHDFVGWRINWQDKAENIARLAVDLNLGLQSVVFLDDNPAERLRVQEALPEVLVPDWPADVSAFPDALNQLTCFDSASLTAEDRQRTAMYQAERRRNAAKEEIASLDQWLRRLQTAVQIEPLNEANLVRATQLLNKTNQMNLTTRRLTQSEFLQWSRHPSHHVWTLSVADVFGSQGLTGLLSVEPTGDATLRIVDFVLSCRVIGRQIEQLMLAKAVEHGRSSGYTGLVAVHRPTDKNMPCLEVFQESGFQHDAGSAAFVWDLRQPYPRPEFIRVEEAGPATATDDRTLNDGRSREHSYV